MPAGNVVISGTFSQTPVESVYLKILSVSVNSTITPELGYESDKYTAKIPHIYPTDTNQKFSIIAIPEDPNAEVLISPASQDDNGEFLLNEGKSEYTITVKSEKPETKTYTFTVDYEPDLSLKSIELSTGENSEWTHTIPVQDEQPVAVPYDSVTIAASPNGEGVTLEASKTGSGNLSTDEPGQKWMLTNIQSTSSTVLRIKSSKTAGDKVYTKEYILNFVKTEDSEYPTSYWAASTGEGNGVSIIKDGGNYYEVHTFITSGTLSVNSVPEADSLTARMLVVAGGGGAGGAAYPSSGAGAGGMVENDSYPITTGSYAVVVGVGGTGGAPKPSGGQPADGTDGGNSSFGDPESGGILAYGGGASLKRETSSFPSGYGNAGGSGGGGLSGGAKKDGKNGISYGNPGGAVSGKDNTAAGGGGAGGSGSSGEVKLGDNKNGLYGGAGRENDITGQIKVYAAGGMTTPYNNNEHHAGNDGAPNTGNGGGGGWQNNGGNGGSGIVVVRFPAKPNPTADE
jgi:hypothetical protein